MDRTIVLCGLLTSLCMLSGCVERRYVITSDPPGALVLENGRPIGPAPVDNTFVYYGNHHFTVVRDGFETLQADQDIPAPWYDRFPFDFFSENIIPWTISDVRRVHFKLSPLQKPNVSEVGERAQQLRQRSQAIPTTPQVAEGP